ncbi:hypothetical protein ACFOQM_14970 [Paenibacillus sp. GCM10012307]|uniref:Uncharacterized protein n=1 Tax=Paenibacillus roseus TaxID=2798579 RepID=A0A934J3F4_9BACL|nr:hypothetical protein [Paenibacillus roseus]MBJ6362564.1 hypothetical protein [Paenibacillus roseus]
MTTKNRKIEFFDYIISGILNQWRSPFGDNVVPVGDEAGDIQKNPTG